MRGKTIDKPFLLITLLLVTAGFIIFISASLGLWGREGAPFAATAIKQFVFGICFGGVALIAFSNFPYRILRKFSFHILLGALILTALVFLPGLGFEHNGARRWLSFGTFSFQPGEVLKLAFVIYLAAWLSGVKEKVNDIRYGLIPFFILSAVTGGVLLAQPDTDAFIIMMAAGFVMLIVSGLRLRYLLAIMAAGVAGLTALILTRPYLKDRLFAFLDPQTTDYLGVGYQVNQSLIAIGSGGLWGRGFGQSLQKFSFLPEPVGDSIFAVAGEEFGLIGAVALIALFVIFALRGMRIASKAPDLFGGLLASGIVILIISQSFINIASMLALFPLSGTPLVFVSQGGTSLMLALAEVGILLNISRFHKST